MCRAEYQRPRPLPSDHTRNACVVLCAGPSLEISGSLLAMYDSLASRTRAEHLSGQSAQPPQQRGQRPALPCQQGTPLKRSHTHPAPLREQQLRGGRPLSSSSECSSSSSSSSSSSLPRGLDVKKSYLASIESLEDDDAGPGCRSGRSPAATAQLSCRVRSSGPCPHRAPGSQPCQQDEATGAPGSDGRAAGPSYLDRVLQEVVDTERTYVRDLAAIVQGYLKPISEAADGKISQDDLSNLFGNIEDIYSFNSTFLEQLETCGSNPVSIAGCFVANSDGFSVYSEFCTNYPRTVSVLTDLVRKTETAEVIKARQISLHHSLPLGSYLLKPVQRILKYHLFLQNIVKHLDKESEGYPDVKNALSVMTGIAFHINDMKRRHEHAVRVQEIQSLLYGWQGKDLTTYGELVAEGSFRMLGAKALRHLFLFDKVLLIAKKREEGILNHKTHIMCSNLMLIESIQGEPLCFQVVPFNSPCNQYSFQARSLEQKREWCLQLKRAIMESFSAVIPSHAKQLVLELGQTKSQKDLSCDKGSVKKSLSAPEYLKKRKYDRRKSETSLQKAFRLRRGLKKARQISLHHSLPLGSYLLKPVQRILKYHLFLQNIVKHLDKESEGYPDVKNALSVMTGIAFHINDMKRRHEHAVRVQEIQSLLYGWQGKDLTTYGELVAEGSFRMLGAKALRHLFLFDKVLLIAKKREEGILNHKTHIMCSNLMLIESIQGEPLCFQVVPFNSPCNQYSFQARSLEQKREWCLQLKRAIMESFSAVIPSHAKQLVLELGQTKSQKDLLCDKGSVKKSLSAPEYLKKRKYDRRKSETSLQKAFRLRRGLKKGFSQELCCTCSCHLGPSGPTRRASAGALGLPTRCPRCVCSCQASTCAGPSGRLLPINSAPTTPLLSTSAGMPNSAGFPRSPDTWRRWDPGDTSDTENEDNPYGAVDVRRLLRYRPPAPNARAQSCTTEDSSGEYVTFEFANSHARRELSATYGSEGSLSNCCSTDTPDYANLWARLGNAARKAPEEMGAKPSVRRTRSFTEMARTKVGSLLPKRAAVPAVLSELHGSLSELAANGVQNPTAAATWLDRLGDHLPTGGCSRCGSLPRGFQLVPDAPRELSKTQQLRTRAEHLRLQHPEQRPFTIASDKPDKVDFLDDPERYQEVAQLGARRQLREGQGTTTGCSTTPAVSVESVSASPVHPEHKIYRQDEGRSWKSVLSGFGSRFSQLRSSLSPSHEDAPVSAESAEDKGRSARLERFPSRESVRTVDSRTSQSKKILTSLSRAYASVVRSAKPPNPTSPRLHRIHGSAAAAARIARQREPDYFAPKTILALLSKDVRPDSVLSGSSNRTSSSSSDTDKLAEMTRSLAIHESFVDLGDDPESDDSDASADSYYERTFEAIENVLAEEMFRDSAIYSDPEDADASAGEYAYEKSVVVESTGEPCALSTLCVRKVKGAIVEKLRVLQENSTFKTDEAAKPAVEGFKSIQQRRMELERWRRQRGEEAEDREVPHGEDPPATDTLSQSKGWVKHLVDRFQTGT
ncbi:uncharacterized protein ISCGN_030112 [Ixodes scapularis]